MRVPKKNKTNLDVGKCSKKIAKDVRNDQHSTPEYVSCSNCSKYEGLPVIVDEGWLKNAEAIGLVGQSKEQSMGENKTPEAVHVVLKLVA